MKKIQNIVLLVLLFSFSILSAHDYIVADSSSNCEKLYKSFQKEGTQKGSIDSLSNLHKHIHQVMDIPRIEETFLQTQCKNSEILDLKIDYISFVSSVLKRPPLSL